MLDDLQGDPCCCRRSLGRTTCLDAEIALPAVAAQSCDTVLYATLFMPGDIRGGL